MGKKNDLKAITNRFKAAASPFRAILGDLHAKYLSVREGAVADYIPELATANPDWFSICAVTVDGQVYSVGDKNQLFTLQSISNALVYGLALEDHGRDYVLTKVGVEPTKEAFNEIVFDEQSQRPYNPMVSAGAIATTGLILGTDSTQRLNRMLDMFRRYIGRDIGVDISVFASQRATGHRHRAIADMMLDRGMIDKNIDQTLDLYFQQCSLLVSCRDLAVMAATLANRGVNPVTGERAIDAQYVKDILSVMYTCAMYDAGEWAYKVGTPALSGVAGGIIAIVPGQMGIGVFSPLLDARGNSVRGIKVCEELSRHFDLHLFNLQVDSSQFLKTIGSRAATELMKSDDNQSQAEELSLNP